MGEVFDFNARRAKQLGYDAWHEEFLRCCTLTQKGVLSPSEKAWCLALFKEGYKRFDDDEVRNALAFTVRIIELYF